jgi:hypothetical protein
MIMPSGIFQVIATLAGSLLSGALAPKKEKPEAPAPVVAPTPEAVVEEVDPGESVTIDQAKEQREAKRRRAKGDTGLFSLSASDSKSVKITKSLLGE